MYREKQVIDVVARTERAARRAKKHEQNLHAMGVSSGDAAKEEKHDHDHDHAHDEKK